MHLNENRSRLALRAKNQPSVRSVSRNRDYKRQCLCSKYPEQKSLGQLSYGKDSGYYTNLTAVTKNMANNIQIQGHFSLLIRKKKRISLKWINSAIRDYFT